MLESARGSNITTNLTLAVRGTPVTLLSRPGGHRDTARSRRPGGGHTVHLKKKT